MMMNLFSMFDPSTYLFNSAWLLVFFITPFLGIKMWKPLSGVKLILASLISSFQKEMKQLLPYKQQGLMSLPMLLFSTILFLNVMALFPFNFSLTAHLSMNLPLSLLVWATIFGFSWLKKTHHVLAHLVPQGTPPPLMHFMVLIEMVSNLIRPLTLCVRLTANLVAGHLLMSLLGSALTHSSTPTMVMSIILPISLTILETAVACIQAYVFMTLITLYTGEVL